MYIHQQKEPRRKCRGSFVFLDDLLLNHLLAFFGRGFKVVIAIIVILVIIRRSIRIVIVIRILVIIIRIVIVIRVIFFVLFILLLILLPPSFLSEQFSFCPCVVFTFVCKSQLHRHYCLHKPPSASFIFQQLL